MAQQLLFTADISATLDQVLEGLCLRPSLPPYRRKYPAQFACRFCRPAQNWPRPTLSASNPTIPTRPSNRLPRVWQALSDRHATRRSVMVNLGGGMVTDLGGFAAATFKRGIRYFNLPTTLLGAVDAAVGGKTGINFNGLKNEIGAFAPAEAVLVTTRFFCQPFARTSSVGICRDAQNTDSSVRLPCMSPFSRSTSPGPTLPRCWPASKNPLP